VSVRVRPSAPQIKNLTGLCSVSTEDSACANKSELLNQPACYLAARGEKEENKLDIIQQRELSESE
jgi:hypothetical protein